MIPKFDVGQKRIIINIVEYIIGAKYEPMYIKYLDGQVMIFITGIIPLIFI